MNHERSKIIVYATQQYNLFKKVEGNRGLNLTKIKRIIREIQHGNDILDEVPILVSEKNGKLEVIDGQHRLEIARKLKRPVHYIIRKELSLHQVANINSNVEKWKPADFINCYITAGNKNYSKLREFMEDYQIPLSVSLILLHNGIVKNEGGNDNLKEEFQKGTYVVKYWKQAVDIAHCCKQFDQHQAWNSRAFVVAICKLLQADKCDFDELVKKFLKDPKLLEKHGNYKHYLTNLEVIYNIGNRIRRPIF